MGLRATYAKIRVLWRLRITGVQGNRGKRQFGIRAIRAKGHEGIRATGVQGSRMKQSFEILT